MSGTSIGVVVCTYTTDRLEMLAEAVSSIEAQTLSPERLLVVVDQDHTVTAAVREHLADTSAEVVGVGRNLGVGGARNHGADHLDTDLVAFLDDDAVAEPDWLARLADPILHEQPGRRALGVGGSSHALFDAGQPSWLPDHYLWTVGCSYAGMSATLRETRNFYGGCSLVRRDAFWSVDGFRSDYGHRGDRVGGGEDSDFCIRALAAHPGSMFLFEPGAVIHHRVPTARLTFGYLLRRCFVEGVVKATIAQGAAPDALGPEREFARTLPAAFFRDLRSGSVRRAGSLAAATASVLAGMVWGRVRSLAVARPGGAPR